MTGFDSASVRRQRTATIRAAVDATHEAALATRGWLRQDPIHRILEQARRQRWAEVDRLVLAAKKRHRARLDALAAATEQLEQAWLQNHDYGHPATEYDDALRRAVADYQRRHPSTRPRSSAASRIDPVATILEMLSHELRQQWARMISRTASLDHVLAVARFNLPGREPLANAEIDAVLHRALTGLRLRLADRAVFAAGAWADGHAMAAARQLPAALSAARQALRATAAERIAAAERIRSLEWTMAAMRTIEWRCLWPHVGDAGMLVKAASLPIRVATMPDAKTPQALMQHQPRSGAVIAAAGRVAGLVITHERRVPITRFRLESESGNAAVAIKATGYKADSTGLVNGADAVVPGTWRRDGGRGELLVARAGLAAAQRTSFDGFLESELRSIWLRVPHSLAFRFSWVRGFDGPLNPVRYQVAHDG